MTKSKDLIIATNGYTSNITPWLNRRNIPIGSYVIATEENGEVAREVYEKRETKLFLELIQACAVYFAWAEAVHQRLGGADDKTNN